MGIHGYVMMSRISLMYYVIIDTWMGKLPNRQEMYCIKNNVIRQYVSNFTIAARVVLNHFEKLSILAGYLRC